MRELLQHSLITLYNRHYKKLRSKIRVNIYRALGMQIGKNVFLSNIRVTRPSQISLGDNVKIEHDVYFKYSSGYWRDDKKFLVSKKVFIGFGCEFNINTGIEIGEYTNIASGCKFIDHDHGKNKNEWIGLQAPINGKIMLGYDVWLGCNVIVLKGVHIGNGAIVGAGSVVTKSIPPYEIWAGIPAKKIGERK